MSIEYYKNKINLNLIDKDIENFIKLNNLSNKNTSTLKYTSEQFVNYFNKMLSSKNNYTIQMIIETFDNFIKLQNIDLNIALLYKEIPTIKCAIQQDTLDNKIETLFIKENFKKDKIDELEQELNVFLTRKHL